MCLVDFGWTDYFSEDQPEVEPLNRSDSNQPS